jgi:hypothetical protein
MPFLHRSTRLRIALVAFLALACAAAAVPPAGAKPPRHHTLTKAQKQRAIAHLRKKVRKTPKLLFSRAFAREASLIGFNLPLTLRLVDPTGSGTANQLEINWSNATFAEPSGFSLLQPPTNPTVVTLSGSLPMVLDFGADMSGYGILGLVASKIMPARGFTATPFPIASYLVPASGCTDSTLAVQPASPSEASVSLVPSEVTNGYLGMFDGHTRGVIHFQSSFASQIVSTCGGSPQVEATATSPLTSSDPPIPIRYDGRFTVTPAIKDGVSRFGRLIIDNNTTPQDASFAQIFSCTNALPGDCNRQPFPAFVRLLHLDADLLLGDV